MAWFIVFISLIFFRKIPFFCDFFFDSDMTVLSTKEKKTSSKMIKDFGFYWLNSLQKNSFTIFYTVFLKHFAFILLDFFYFFLILLYSN